jgi:hypothetical protein
MILFVALAVVVSIATAQNLLSDLNDDQVQALRNVTTALRESDRCCQVNFFSFFFFFFGFSRLLEL